MTNDNALPADSAASSESSEDSKALASTDFSVESFFDDNVSPKIQEKDAPQEKTGVQKIDETEENTDKKGEKDPATPAESEPEEAEDKAKTGLKAALAAEREKRQKIEREFDEFRKGLDNGKRADAESEQKQAEDPYEPDPMSDPQGYREWIRAETRKAIFEERLAVTQEHMQEEKPDYDETVEVFKELCQSDRSLAEKLVKSRNPAKFAYDTAKAYLENKRLSDPESRKAWEAKIRDEARAEALAEFKKESAAQSEDRNRKAMETPDLLKIGGGAARNGGSLNMSVESFF